MGLPCRRGSAAGTTFTDIPDFDDLSVVKFVLNPGAPATAASSTLPFRHHRARPSQTARHGDHGVARLRPAPPGRCPKMDIVPPRRSAWHPTAPFYLDHVMTCRTQHYEGLADINSISAGLLFLARRRCCTARTSSDDAAVGGRCTARDSSAAVIDPQPSAWLRCRRVGVRLDGNEANASPTSPRDNPIRWATWMNDGAAHRVDSDGDPVGFASGATGCCTGVRDFRPWLASPPARCTAAAPRGIPTAAVAARPRLPIARWSVAIILLIPSYSLTPAPTAATDVRRRAWRSKFMSADTARLRRRITTSGKASTAVKLSRASNVAHCGQPAARRAATIGIDVVRGPQSPRPGRRRWPSRGCSIASCGRPPTAISALPASVANHRDQCRSLPTAPALPAGDHFHASRL